MRSEAGRRYLGTLGLRNFLRCCSDLEFTDSDVVGACTEVLGTFSVNGFTNRSEGLLNVIKHWSDTELAS